VGRRHSFEEPSKYHWTVCRLRQFASRFPACPWIDRATMPTLCRGKERYRIFLYICGLIVCYQFLYLIRLPKGLGDEVDQRSLQPPNLHHDRKKASKFRTVDILSVGSNLRLDYLQAQQNTFARHVSVRNFFNATEDTDADP
jgi:hypothetical protein